MGCDIHLFAEYNDGEKWRLLKGEFKQWDGGWGDEIDVGRNYELFSFLADVRNDDGIQPLDRQRGVPDDASLGYRAEVEDWDADGHSFSWFTLKELKNIPQKLLEQEFNDTHLILKKDEIGKILETCRATNGEHLGPVGIRKLFGLWGTDPIKKIVDDLNSARPDGVEDDKIRIVFFFDN